MIMQILNTNANTSIRGYRLPAGVPPALELGVA